MLTNRNTLIVKLNLITMPEQIIKVSECQPTTVWRIVVLFTKQRQQLLASRSAIFTALAKTCSTCPCPRCARKSASAVSAHTHRLSGVLIASLPVYAPAAISNCAISSKPRSRASSSGVLPYLSVRCGLAPCSSNNCTIACCLIPPSLSTIASSSGVQPTWLVWLTLISVCAKSSFTILKWPFSQAGVRPTPPKRVTQLRSGLAGKIIRSSVKSSFRQLIKKDLNRYDLAY